ncbi:cupredoxin domain-containing protein [Micromonospora sp. MS34]|uniref:cupredoxin domain-containing protein n=1 Tax=Micromonospora sp. MS34 TaxID=3385971 RepID=UPI0039A06E96
MKFRTVTVVAAICATAALAACGEDAAPKGGGVAVTATDTTCEVATTSFAAGEVTFAVTNKGKQTTEVYVYGQQGDDFTKVVAEVENVAPGLSRNLTATLVGGTYEVACKPGQSGAGIRTRITVSGGSAGARAEAESAYDREIEVEVTASGVEGADGLTARTGEKIEFKLENKTTAARSLEVVDPAGKVAAEISADPNGEAETIVPLANAGAWTLKIEGAGVATVSKPLTVG